MSSLLQLLEDLVIANHILAHHGVVDASGHVSVRHPERADRFFMSRSRSSALVTLDDLMEFDLECRPIDRRKRTMYSERPIHGATYQVRPDVHAVIHNHAIEVIPFGIAAGTTLRPIMHTAAMLGTQVPVWDIRDKFGSDTDLLVVNVEHGRDLALRLGSGYVCLMRGHGSVVAGISIYHAVHTAIYLSVNARLQTQAMQMGEVTYLSTGETDAMTQALLHGGSLGPQSRTWEYWTAQVRRSSPSRKEGALSE